MRRDGGRGHLPQPFDLSWPDLALRGCRKDLAQAHGRDSICMSAHVNPGASGQREAPLYACSMLLAPMSRAASSAWCSLMSAACSHSPCPQQASALNSHCHFVHACIHTLPVTAGSQGSLLPPNPCCMPPAHLCPQPQAACASVWQHGSHELPLLLCASMPTSRTSHCPPP